MLGKGVYVTCSPRLWYNTCQTLNSQHDWQADLLPANRHWWDSMAGLPTDWAMLVWLPPWLPPCCFIFYLNPHFIFQVVKMLIIVLVTFVVTWLPSMILVILRYHHIGKYINNIWMFKRKVGIGNNHSSLCVKYKQWTLITKWCLWTNISLPTFVWQCLIPYLLEEQEYM